MKCISPVFVRKMMMHVPCGKCAFCMEKRIKSWVVRIREELAISSSALFLTLTYADEYLPEDGQLCVRDLQLFIKSVRQENKGVRYYAVGEYGSQGERPHYHIVMFNLVDRELITKFWTKGFVKGDRLTMGRVRYAVGYFMASDDREYKVKPFAVMSRNPGIGYSYVTRMGKYHRARSDSVVFDFDCANAMPRYYLDKIFDKGHRRYINLKRARYSMELDQPDPTHAEHEKLLSKLKRKFK